MYGLEVYVVFCLVIFLFNQSKNYANLEPRTKHFRGLLGFEAKAKDFKMCPQGQGRPQGLHLCYLTTCFWVVNLTFQNFFEPFDKTAPQIRKTVEKSNC